jgi:hypothetical protein
MIRYALHCAQSHDFESWFQSAAAFDRLAQQGHVACPLCGGTDVTKALMAPSVVIDIAPPTRPGHVASPAGVPDPRPTQSHEAPPALRTPRTDLERGLADLRDRIERESDYVGLSFASEARAMHDGTAPERPIWGEARPDDARKLIEDGVPVAPLPFLPRRKAN